MLKNLIQQLFPSFILKRYKQEKFFRLIRDFEIADEPDLIIAQKLCHPKKFVIDIGANIGLYSKFLSPFSSKIIALEPVPFTFEILGKNLDRLNIENVTLLKYAISADKGEKTITVPIQAGVRNYFRASISGDAGGEQTLYSFTVETTTLDALYSTDIENFSLIKCDVEGHELQCVLGAEQILGSQKPAWLIEVSEDPDQNQSSSFKLFEIMKNSGYRAFWFDGKTLFERRTGDSSINYFFLSQLHLEALLNKKVNIVEL